MFSLRNKLHSGANVLNISRLLRFGFVLVALSLRPQPARADARYAVTGILLKADPSHKTMIVSCREIPGYMDAMVMSFTVQEPAGLALLKPGNAIEFTLRVAHDASFAENVRLLPFQNLELDPTEVRRLKLLEHLTAQESRNPRAVAIGQMVPNFTLTDQDKKPVALSQLAGKVVAVSFIYTRCPRPEYCFRLSNNFGRLQQKFKARMGRDLVLLSIVIDPANDQPDALANYARIWKTTPEKWHFLTGPLPVIQQVCGWFDMSFYPDEALLLHSFRTAVLDRRGKMAAVLDGNDYTFQQLADLVETVMNQPN